MIETPGKWNLAAVAKCFAAYVLATCSGCGSGVPVEGVVTMNGKPLAKATITLVSPERSRTDRTYRAETDAEGRYQLESADGRAEGVPPGDYNLFITSVQLPPNLDETTKVPPDPVPQKWRDGSQTFTVPAGGSTEANFTITSR